MRELKLNDDIYMLPGTWDELTIQQLVFLINLVHRQQTVEEIKLKMLLFCLSAHVRRYTTTDSEQRFTILAKKGKYDFSAEELSAVSDIFSFLFAVYDGKISINPLLTKNPYPNAQCGCRMVYGPEQGLHNITYEQFVLLLTYYQQMQENPDSIHDFLSVIYKCKSGKSSPELMKKMSDTVKTAALWFFLGSLQFMSEKFPLTFSGGGISSGSVFESQMRVVDALASNDVTKKEIVKRSLLYDALYSMEIAAETAEKSK